MIQYNYNVDTHGKSTFSPPPPNMLYLGGLIPNTTATHQKDASPVEEGDQAPLQ